MFRLIAALLFLTAACHAEVPAAPPLSPLALSPLALFTAHGPAEARGVLVWVHGTYDRSASGPPDPPDWISRMAGRGFDVFQFRRDRGNDPLAGSGERLAHGLTALRHAGYRRVLVAGHSRGAWIALEMTAHPGLADAIVAVSPGAHGTRPEQQPKALADWAALWAAAQPGPTRVALIQLADDPYDPDPQRRRDVAIAQARRAGLPVLSVFEPPEPRGHIGIYEPEFDDALGATLADFADPPGPR